MFRAATVFLVLLVAAVASMAEARAERRVALVIGNSDYRNAAPLTNPKNDAADVSAILRRLGFTVVEGTDLDKPGMEDRIRKFAAALQGADVGLFFYAGHGLQVQGKNYLAPVDASLKSETDLDFEAVPLNLVLRQLERNAKLSLVFLDACRDNPMATTLARSLRPGSRSVSIGRGLARVEKAVGMLIAFATQPGNVALDGTGRNSPFTSALLKNIERSDATINDMMIHVRNDVIKQTDGKQVPWENSSLTGKFYFNPRRLGAQPGQKVAAVSPTTRTQTNVPNTTFDHTFWTSIRDSNDPALYKEYLKRFPDGIFAPIARSTLTGMRAIKVEEKPGTTSEAGKKPLKQALAQPGDTASDAGSTPGTPAIDPAVAKAQLARDTQSALKRVGCYVGAIDGLWGNGSRAAIDRFNRIARTALPPDPSASSLTVIKAHTGRRCTVVTTAPSAPRNVRRTTRGERKKTRKAPTRTTRRPPPRKRRTARPSRRSAPPPSSGGSGNTSIFIGRGVGGLIVGGGMRF